MINITLFHNEPIYKIEYLFILIGESNLLGEYKKDLLLVKTVEALGKCRFGYCDKKIKGLPTIVNSQCIMQQAFLVPEELSDETREGIKA